MVSYQFGNKDEAPSGGASCVDHSLHCCNPLPFPFVWYIENYADSIAGLHFSMIRLAGHVREICDVFTACSRDTTFGASK